MKKDDYVTVAEFAKQVGFSRQAIYSRLDKDLTEFVKVVDNAKMINLDALTLFDKENTCKVIDKQFDNSLLITLQATIDVLTKELDIKNVQIKDLNQRLSEAMELNKNNQILIAREQEQLTSASSDGAEEPKKSLLNRLFNKGGY